MHPIPGPTACRVGKLHFDGHHRVISGGLRRTNTPPPPTPRRGCAAYSRTILTLREAHPESLPDRKARSRIVERLAGQRLHAWAWAPGTAARSLLTA